MLMTDYLELGSLHLDDLYDLPSSTLYRFLKPLKKEEYADNERIVFYNYGKINNDVLDHLYQMLLNIDIPEFFILIISNQLSTVDYLKDKIPVQLVNYPEQVSKAKSIHFNTYNNYCAYAWAGIHVFPDGSVRPCCDANEFISKPDGTLYNINESGIDEIINSDWMKNLRHEFRTGVKPSPCSQCFNREKFGLESRRSIAPYKLENIYGKINWEDEGQLMYFGAHLGNVCNLKCRICSENFSSSIANELMSELPAENRKNSSYYKILKASEWVFDPSFWNDLKEKSSTIKNFEILGGEPLILKENNKFVEWLVDTNQSQDVCFYFTTNGTQYPKFLDTVNNFKRMEITVSIDNINERFEYERYGANWNVVENNVKKLIQKQNSGNFLKIDHCITVNIQNAYYLPEIIEWSNSIGFNSYYINYVTIPIELSFNALTSAAKELILTKLTKLNVNSKLDSIINAIRASGTSDGAAFYKTMKHLDQLRNQNFSDLYPEIAKAMGYR